MSLTSSTIRQSVADLDLASPLRKNSQFEAKHLLVAVAILKRYFHHDEQTHLCFCELDTFSPVDLEVDRDTQIGDLLDSTAEQLSDRGSLTASEDAWVVSLDDSIDCGEPSSTEVHFQYSQLKQRVTVSGCSVEKADLELWAKCLAKLLVSIAESNPDESALSLDFVAESTRQEIISHSESVSETSGGLFSRTPSAEFTFPFQFEKQAAATPGRIAVVAAGSTSSALDAADRQLTYLELNEAANQVAWWLIDQGIKPQSAIGVYMHRSPRMLAVLIGIQKAGCHYVPLSTDLPRERLAFMVSDASIQSVVTECGLANATHEFLKSVSDDVPTVLEVDGEPFAATKSDSRNRQNPAVEITSKDLAYTIYTSGSTGMPKGVQIGHHSFVNFCGAAIEMLGFTADDVSLAITTIAFDVSVGELFPLLLAGGKVGIAAGKVGASADLFAKALDSVGATYTAATPTTLRILLASGWQGDAGLTVITGGEAISRETCNALAKRCKRLVNGYGPTEATVYSTFGVLSEGEGPVPIGRPVLNYRAYILDDFGRMVPPTVHGELFIAGEALAKGYLNRDDLTEQAFRLDPFSDVPGARMYATGDVCYFEHDGEVFYLGRKDNQVKIRGYRIELGEIETRLAEHAAIGEAVVIAREDNPDDKRLVAYLILANSDAMPSDSELQDHLATTMPEYMVPAWFVPMQSFPNNRSGKLDRKALPMPETVFAVDAEIESDPLPVDRNREFQDPAELAAIVAAAWSKVLSRRVRVDDEVFRMGADSLKAVAFQLELEQACGLRVPTSEIFQFRTPAVLAKRFTSTSTGQRRRKSSGKATQSGAIAIVGMAGRFPGAANLDQYWENLVQGVESIRDFTEQELADAGVSALEYRQDNYIPRGTTLKDAFAFDPEFFGITRGEAELISPQIRLFMQTAFEALEHGGYPEEPAEQRIGVFAGAGYPNYLQADFGTDESRRLQVLAGNGPDYIATRTSFALGLTGPAMSIHTACSTSLVAVAEACAAIRQGRCEMAVAGGASWSWPAGKGYMYGPGLIYSNDGHCRAFDHRGSGTIFSQGVGAVLLKPLEDAVADGDTIHAVIHGVATNNDGDRKGGFFSPSIEGQADVIKAALDDADLSPESLSYVEAHGTATNIGDPIEISGLTSAWSSSTDRKQFCGIGSVKTNIGHTDAAAGIAGLLKVALAIKHGQLPATLNYEAPNPEIDFAETPFYVQDKLADWDPESGRIAAVSAFGLGGTNAHAILGQPPAIVEADESKEPTSVDPLRVVPLSARTETSLSGAIGSWRSWAETSDDRFEDMVFTLRRGRKSFRKRTFAIASAEDAHLAETEFYDANAPCLVRSPVFLFTGQGSQYVKMAIESYNSEPVFRGVIDQCDQLLRKSTSRGLVDWLYADGDADVDINDTQFAQLAIFATGLAQARLWMSWGVTPSALLGHSIGEYIAATIAGVMTLETAIAIVAKRGELMQAMDPGAMVAVMQGAEETKALIAKFSELEIAVINSRSVTVVAGPFEAIEQFEAQLNRDDVQYKRLKTSHAFHSRMMEPLLDEFRAFVSQFSLSPPSIPVQSNVTGTWMTDEQATSADYYAMQIRSTVRFAENVASILASDSPQLMLEIGAGSALTHMASRIAAEEFREGDHATIATMPSAKTASSSDLNSNSVYANRLALGQMWACGNTVDWDKVESWSKPPRRISMPTYSFDLAEYRVTSDVKRLSVKAELPANRWFHMPVWNQVPETELPSSDQVDANANWLVITGQRTPPQAAAHIQNAMSAASLTVVQQPANVDDLVAWQSIVSSAAAKQELAGVIHLASLCPQAESSVASVDEFKTELADSARSVTWLAKAIGEIGFEKPVQLVALTSGATNGDLNDRFPTAANHSLIGTLAVIQKEYREITTRLLNFDCLDSLESSLRSNRLSQRIECKEHLPLLAWHARKWWRHRFENVELVSNTGQDPESETDFLPGHPAPLVFTGGLGSLSLGILGHWAGMKKLVGANVVLLVRNALPPIQQWPSLDASNTSQQVLERVTAVRALEDAGVGVEMLVADCSDSDQLSSALDSVVTKHGKIGTLLHTAGVLRDGTIAGKLPEQFSQVYAAKSLAAQHIAQWSVKNNTSIGRVVLFSSISAELGLFGQVDYSGANNVLDGVAAQLNYDGRVKCTSINWPAIADSGMASRSSKSISNDASLAKELSENSLYVSEAADVLVTLLSNGPLTRVVVGRTAFEARRQSAIADGRSVTLSGPMQRREFDSDDVKPSDVMLAIWRDQFGNPELADNDDYFNMGGDSLMAVGMISSIEKAFGQVVPISHLINSPTVAKLVRKLGLETATEDGKTSTVGDCQSESHVYNESDSSRFVVKLRDGDRAKTPLVLLHGADGAVMFYREFARQLSTERSIFAIEAPSLGDVNAGFGETVEQIAKQYVDALQKLQPVGPYSLAGYSFGGVVAFAMVAELESRGETVEQAIIYDVANPSKVEYSSSIERLKTFWTKQESQNSIAKTLKLGKRVTRAVKDRATVELENRIAAGKQVDALESAFWRHKRARERHMEIEQHYVATPVQAPIRVVIASESGGKLKIDSKMGWGDVAPDLETHSILGSHLDLFDQPWLDGIIQATEKFLN